MPGIAEPGYVVRGYVQTQLDVRRAGERLATRSDWLDSKHSFSFGGHYDPLNTHFGLLLVSNDDIVRPGAGFETHPHRDMEIITWVLEGSLVHQDSAGHSGVIYPGLAQRMSAGTGILHSEKNDAWRLQGTSKHDNPVHFVQMWVIPDETGVSPGYEQLDITADLDSGGLVTVASGGKARIGDRAAIRIRQRDATLHAARLAAGETIAIPAAPYVHLFVARGNVELDGAELDGAGMLGLGRGDAVRVTAADGQQVAAVTAAEVLVWEMRSALR